VHFEIEKRRTRIDIYVTEALQRLFLLGVGAYIYLIKGVGTKGKGLLPIM